MRWLVSVTVVAVFVACAHAQPSRRGDDGVYLYVADRATSAALESRCELRGTIPAGAPHAIRARVAAVGANVAQPRRVGERMHNFVSVILVGARAWRCPDALIPELEATLQHEVEIPDE